MYECLLIFSCFDASFIEKCVSLILASFSNQVLHIRCSYPIPALKELREALNKFTLSRKLFINGYSKIGLSKRISYLRPRQFPMNKRGSIGEIQHNPIYQPCNLWFMISFTRTQWFRPCLLYWKTGFLVGSYKYNVAKYKLHSPPVIRDPDYTKEGRRLYVMD